MGRGPGPSKMEQIHIYNMAQAWPNFSPDRAIMIKNKKIRNHEKVRFYYSSVLSLSASKILLHDKNVHKRQDKQS